MLSRLWRKSVTSSFLPCLPLTPSFRSRLNLGTTYHYRKPLRVLIILTVRQGREWVLETPTIWKPGACTLESTPHPHPRCAKTPPSPNRNRHPRLLLGMSLSQLIVGEEGKFDEGALLQVPGDSAKASGVYHQKLNAGSSGGITRLDGLARGLSSDSASGPPRPLLRRSSCSRIAAKVTVSNSFRRCARTREELGSAGERSWKRDWIGAVGTWDVSRTVFAKTKPEQKSQKTKYRFAS